MVSLEVRHVHQSDKLVVPLLEDLTREYTGRYGRLHEDLFTYPASRFAPPDGAFILLVESGEAVAGGAFQKYDDGTEDLLAGSSISTEDLLAGSSISTAELKRIWTHGDHRRRGLAAKVVQELEKEAAARGYARIYLTTGPRQPEAKGLYLAAGYTPLFDVDADPLTIGPLPFEKALR